MRFLAIFAIVCFAIAGVFSVDWSGEQTRQSAALADQQRALLVRLEAMNDASVSEFVRDWREAYPNATAASVEELAVAVAAIEADHARAKTMTRAAKQEAMDALPFKPVLASTPEAKPGL